MYFDTGTTFMSTKFFYAGVAIPYLCASWLTTAVIPTQITRSSREMHLGLDSGIKRGHLSKLEGGLDWIIIAQFREKQKFVVTSESSKSVLWIRIRIIVGSRIRIRVKSWVRIRVKGGSKLNGAMEVFGVVKSSQMEPWKAVCRLASL